MRTSIFAAFAAFALIGAARADDTKPPQISDVKATARGGKVTIEARITDETGVLSATVHHRSPGGRVEDSPMVKDEYSDIFKASFAGGGETEYWIDSSDLLGNGPSTYGSASKAFAVGGKPSSGKATAAAEPEEKREPVREQPPPEEPKRREHRTRTVKAAEPPAIEYKKPGAQPPEGRDLTLRLKIKSESPVAVAILLARPQGTAAFTNSKIKSTGGDNYEAEIPASMAHGTVEYFMAAKNQAGLATRQGDGDPETPYLVTFKAAAAAPASTATAASAPPPAKPAASAGPYSFTDLPPYRIPPGRPIVLRAQVVPSAEGEMPDKVTVLWRGNDAQDQATEMVADPSGGYGGFKAELPAQDEGAVFFQIVACDAQASKCAVDTGSKRRWHATSIASNPGGAQPMALDAVSSKAPPTLPE